MEKRNRVGVTENSAAAWRRSPFAPVEPEFQAGAIYAAGWLVARDAGIVPLAEVEGLRARMLERWRNDAAYAGLIVERALTVRIGESWRAVGNEAVAADCRLSGEGAAVLTFFQDPIIRRALSREVGAPVEEGRTPLLGALLRAAYEARQVSSAPRTYAAGGWFGRR